jgi:hypothetical protein
MTVTVRQALASPSGYRTLPVGCDVHPEPAVLRRAIQARNSEKPDDVGPSGGIAPDARPRRHHAGGRFVFQGYFDSACGKRLPEPISSSYASKKARKY